MRYFLSFALTGMFAVSFGPAQAASNMSGSNSIGGGANQAGSTSPQKQGMSGSNLNQQGAGTGTSGSNSNQQGAGTGTSASNSNQQGAGTSGSTPTYGTPVVGQPANTYTQSCLQAMTVNTQFDSNWLPKYAGAGAYASNVNQIQVNLFNSYIDPGYVACHYRSARTEINNLVYKFVCKNAIKAGVHQYYCAK